MSLANSNIGAAMSSKIEKTANRAARSLTIQPTSDNPIPSDDPGLTPGGSTNTNPTGTNDSPDGNSPNTSTDSGDRATDDGNQGASKTTSGDSTTNKAIGKDKVAELTESSKSFADKIAEANAAKGQSPFDNPALMAALNRPPQQPMIPPSSPKPSGGGSSGGGPKSSPQQPKRSSSSEPSKSSAADKLSDDIKGLKSDISKLKDANSRSAGDKEKDELSRAQHGGKSLTGKDGAIPVDKIDEYMAAVLKANGITPVSVAQNSSPTAAPEKKDTEEAEKTKPDAEPSTDTARTDGESMFDGFDDDQFSVAEINSEASSDSDIDDGVEEYAEAEEVEAEEEVEEEVEIEEEEIVEDEE